MASWTCRRRPLRLTIRHSHEEEFVGICGWWVSGWFLLAFDFGSGPSWASACSSQCYSAPPGHMMCSEVHQKTLISTEASLTTQMFA
mmetsp:Transcript_40708/g.107837  ORF Transcript_40708/g.107837 Transcript_40708/m.107837 type:complete len:87 (+) Transcript_40708:808-1068(+)